MVWTSWATPETVPIQRRRPLTDAEYTPAQDTSTLPDSAIHQVSSLVVGLILYQAGLAAKPIRSMVPENLKVCIRPAIVMPIVTIFPKR